MAVGLNSIPSWYKPYNVLSNGENLELNVNWKLMLWLTNILV
jgi:hypothetical protein